MNLVNNVINKWNNDNKNDEDVQLEASFYLKNDLVDQCNIQCQTPLNYICSYSLDKKCPILVDACLEHVKILITKYDCNLTCGKDEYETGTVSSYNKKCGSIHLILKWICKQDYCFQKDNDVKMAQSLLVITQR